MPLDSRERAEKVPRVLDDAALASALRACEEIPRATDRRELRHWYARDCVAAELQRSSGVDAERVAEWLDEWVGDRYETQPGARTEFEGPLPTIRYLVLTESQRDTLLAEHEP
jgi:hypothetical protein